MDSDRLRRLIDNWRRVAAEPSTGVGERTALRGCATDLERALDEAKPNYVPVSKTLDQCL